MPIYSIQAPNGKTYSIEGPEGASQDQVIDEVLRQHPEAEQAAKPAEGMLAALGKGAESLVSQARTGIGALFGSPEAAATAGLARGEDIGKRYADQTSLDRVKQVYEKQGLLPAAGEVISQVPAALAEQAPNIATTLTGARLGAMAGSAFGPVGSVLGGLGGAALPTATQIFGSNVERQAAEQQKAGLPTSIDVSAAALATAPATALDVAGSFIPLGGRLVSKLTGIPTGALLGKSAAATTKLAEERLLATLTKGTATGALAEIPTEVAQQMLERAQAGLSLTDEDALKEYGETAYQVGLLAPIGAAGRLSERGGARAEVEAKAELAKRKERIEALGREEEAAKVQAEADAAEAARKQTPEFALEAEQTYNALKEQLKTLRDQSQVKVDQNDPDAVASKKEAAAQLKALKESDEFKTAVADYRATKGIRAQLTQEQADAAAAKAAVDKEAAIRAELALLGQERGVQPSLPGFEPTETITPMPEMEPAEVTDYANQVRQLKQLDEDQQTQIAKTSDPEELIKLLDQQDKTRAALAKAIEAAAATPKALGDKLASAMRRLETAKEDGDSAKIRKYAQEVLDLKAQGVTDQQQEIPLVKFKGKSETTQAFNARTYEPQGYTPEGQPTPLEQPYADYLRDQDELDRLRQEGATEADIAQMEKLGRMGVLNGQPAAVSEQGLLFGTEMTGGIKSGEEKAAPVASRAELQADLQIARDTGNKAAASLAQKQLAELTTSEKSEDKFAGTTEGIAPTISRAQQPVRVSQQQAASDARAQAYADMVSIVSKYNKGLAKAADLETARAAVVDNLIADIEATRGSAVPEAEARAIAAQANQLLHDLVSRFGDTRNLSQKDKELFLPAQNKDGSFSTAPVAGMGMPTVESRAPGRQTFAKQYAASQTIKEGLNELRNKAVAQQQTTVERTLSVAQDTEQALRDELDRAFAKGDIPPAQRQVLEAIGDNLRVISGNPESRSMAAAYAARINARIAPSAELTADLNLMLAQIEQAKRSETQTETRETAFGTGQKTTTAQQGDLFASDKELQGYAFDTPAAFNAWLASDALQQMRSSIGLGMPTVSRLLQRLAPFQKRADAFRAQADALTTRIETLGAEYEALKTRKKEESVLLQEMTAAERTARATQLSYAQNALRDAEARLKDIRDKMDAELSSYQQEFIQAQLAFNFSVKTSEDITKAIAANTTAFQKGEMEAIRKVLDAKKELSDLLQSLTSQRSPELREFYDKKTKKMVRQSPFPSPTVGYDEDKTDGKDWADILADFTKDKAVVAAQQKIVDATRQWRAAFALNQTQNRVVAFLDKDLGFQMQLQEEANQMDELAQRMLNAKMALDLAFKQQQRSRKNQTALRSAGQDVLAARELVTQAEASLAEVDKVETDIKEQLGITRTRKEEGRIVEVMKASTDLETRLVAEMNAASTERDAQLAEARRLTPGMPKQTQRGAAPAQTQADREARDNEQRRVEQESVEALQALPAERVSFEKRRKLLDVVNAVPERVLELDAVIDNADEMIADTQARADRTQAAIADLDKQIEASAKIVFGPDKTFADRLKINSEKIVLNRLRAERAALAETAPRVEAEVAQIKAEKVDAEGKKRVLLERAADIEQQFSNDVQYNEANEALPNPATQYATERIAKIKTLIAKNAAKPETDSRKAAIRKYEREMAQLQARVETKRGIERSSVVKGRVEVAETEAAVGTERLPARVIGPVVRKTGAGQGKVLQAGQVRPLTGLQAQRQSTEAARLKDLEKWLLELEAQQARIEPSIEDANKKKDPARVERLQKYAEKLEAEYAALEAEMNSIYAKTAPAPKSAPLKDNDTIAAEGALFRTSTRGGPTLKTSQIESIAAQVTKNWVNVPDIVVVANEKELPLRLRGQIVKAEREETTPGLFDPVSGKVYLLASNLHSEKDVILTIAHEVAGHFGLRAMLGGDYTRTMNRLYEGNPTVRRQADAKMNADSTLSQQVAVEEVLAELAETGGKTPAEKGALQRIYEALRNMLRRLFGLSNVADAEVTQIVTNARKYVMEGGVAAKGAAPAGDALRRTTAKYASADFAAAGDVADKFVSKQRSTWDRVQSNASGLAFETSYVDRFAGFERLSKQMESLKGYQMMYFLRMYDQRMNFVAQSVANGALRRVEKTRADGQKEYVIEAGGGASLKNVVEILKEAGPLVGNGEALNRIFTTYMSAIRAKDKGFAALHFGNELTQADLDKAMAVVNGNKKVKDIFEAARKEYNAYNRDMLNFAVQSGAVPADLAAKLLKENDYIPWYREERGVALLQIGNEAPIRIGSIAEQPYLHELVGGDKPILDFMTSSVQNTNMLVDMALRNLATKNAVMELVNMNLAKIGKGQSSGTDVVKFKIDGEDRFAIIDTDSAGVPADLLVKGMEGIPTQMPGALRLLAAPATLLRKAVMASPLYMARQVFRDSLAAPILAGANFTPVVGALRQIGASATKSTLERRGITGGQVFTGTSEDLTRILKDIAGNKTGWAQAWGKIEAVSMESDALTRRAQYNSYIQQGLSEMEATLMSLESMNFNKRGASPSVHIIASMIPFFNSQIQSLNVLYKALFGKMPFNEKLKMQQKLLTRGLMLASATLAYAALMQDDEAYKNATPDQKYGNWFVRVPGVSEAVRIPIPFEIGYIFKALPEALFNSMVDKHGKEDAVKAFTTILKNTIPGGSNYGIPQALKPALEAGLGKSFYTGRDILSQQEQNLLTKDQFRANTTELAKTIGKAAGVSPIKLDELIKGYTGGMGLAFVQAISTGIPKGETPENAVKRLSEMPIVGPAFQPNDAGNIANRVYDRMKNVQQVQASFDRAIDRGDRSGAMELVNTYGNELMLSEAADYFKNTMAQFTKYENAIRASRLSPEEKRTQLDKLRQTKTQFAAMVESATDRTTPR